MALHSNQTHTPSYHLFVHHLDVHALMCFRHEGHGVHHDENFVCQATEWKVERNVVAFNTTRAVCSQSRLGCGASVHPAGGGIDGVTGPTDRNIEHY